MDCAAMLDNWLVIAATAADIAVRDKLANRLVVAFVFPPAMLRRSMPVHTDCMMRPTTIPATVGSANSRILSLSVSGSRSRRSFNAAIALSTVCRRAMMASTLTPPAPVALAALTAWSEWPAPSDVGTALAVSRPVDLLPVLIRS